MFFDEMRRQELRGNRIAMLVNAMQAGCPLIEDVQRTVDKPGVTALHYQDVQGGSPPIPKCSLEGFNTLRRIERRWLILGVASRQGGCHLAADSPFALPAEIFRRAFDISCRQQRDNLQPGQPLRNCLSWHFAPPHDAAVEGRRGNPVRSGCSAAKPSRADRNLTTGPAQERVGGLLSDHFR
jgi:hypothetical protein